MFQNSLESLGWCSLGTKHSNILQSLLTRETDWIKAVIIPLQASISKCNTRTKCSLKRTRVKKKLPLWHLCWKTGINYLFAQHRKKQGVGSRKVLWSNGGKGEREPTVSISQKAINNKSRGEANPPPTTQRCQAARSSTLRVLSNKHQPQIWTLDHVSHTRPVLLAALSICFEAVGT